MENEFNQNQDTVYSNKVRAGKRRTYFFDVRKTKGDDYYVTLTEVTRRLHGEGHNRHKIFLYKEDFNRFLEGLQDAVSHVKTELMPEYDYEQFDRRQAEWEKQLAEQKENEAAGITPEEKPATLEEKSAAPEEKPATPEANEGDDGGAVDSEEDMSW